MIWLAVGLWFLAVVALVFFFRGCYHDSDFRRGR